MSILRSLSRIVRFMAHVLRGVMTIFHQRLRHGESWYLAPQGKELVCAWMQKLCAILAVNVTVEGRPVSGRACLYISNHVSWLDIIILASIRSSSFISRESVRRWPVIGFLAASTGTLFIDRHKRQGLKQINKAISAYLDVAHGVVLFPEGTTTDGKDVAPFHSALFCSAIDSSALIQPVAIAYTCNGVRDRLAAYVDDDNFVQHLLGIIARDSTQVRISFARPVEAQQYQRRALAELTHATIRRRLQPLASST